MQMVAWILISCLKSEIKYGNSEDLPTCYFSSSHVSTRDKFHAKRHKPGGLLHDVEIDVLPQQRRSIYKQVTEYSIYQNNQIYKACAVFTTYRFLAQECIRMVELFLFSQDPSDTLPAERKSPGKQQSEIIHIPH